MDNQQQCDFEIDISTEYVHKIHGDLSNSNIPHFQIICSEKSTRCLINVLMSILWK